MLATDDFRDLDWLDDVFSPRLPASSIVHNGFYTLTLPDGTHRTFRIHTKAEKSRFAPGQRIISILTGPENEKDYRGFGFVTEQGLAIWKKYRGSEYERLGNIVWKLANGEVVEGASLLVSRRCLRCNRTLTDPVSIEMGIGPKCREGR